MADNARRVQPPTFDAESDDVRTLGGRQQVADHRQPRRSAQAAHLQRPADGVHGHLTAMSLTPPLLIVLLLLLVLSAATLVSRAASTTRRRTASRRSIIRALSTARTSDSRYC